MSHSTFINQASFCLLLIRLANNSSSLYQETRADTVIDFFKGLSCTIHATFEEGTHSHWLFDIIHPLVSELIVCNPRHNHLLKAGNKDDLIDARKLAAITLAVWKKRESFDEKQVRRKAA